MDIKKMLVKLAEEQAEKIEKELMNKIESDAFAEDLAQKLNDKYDIPFVKEEKEGAFFLSIIGIMQSIVTGLIKSKK
tara:strand:+ start:240 stop:470 length:231 start_codon:yes stop_codon:yes gene_type:complete